MQHKPVEALIPRFIRVGWGSSLPLCRETLLSSTAVRSWCSRSPPCAHTHGTCKGTPPALEDDEPMFPGWGPADPLHCPREVTWAQPYNRCRGNVLQRRGGGGGDSLTAAPLAAFPGSQCLPGRGKRRRAFSQVIFSSFDKEAALP